MSSDTATTAEPGAIPGDEAHDAQHPTDASYIKIAVVLALITAAEVGTYYVPGLEENTPLLLLVLLPMMVVKFTIVARSFMHLKFDNPLFTRVFLAGLMLATIVWLITLATFQFF
jgi:cytochrome c oxidase subunit 4